MCRGRGQGVRVGLGVRESKKEGGGRRGRKGRRKNKKKKEK